MRILEIVLIVVSVLAIYVDCRSGVRRSRWIAWVTAAVCASAFGLHLLHEGPRWQMLPAYVGSFLATVLVAAAPRSGSSKVNKRLSRLAWCAAISMFAGALLSALVPVARLPGPDGPCDVGTRVVSLSDSSRQEVFAEEAGHSRVLVAQIWYPASPGGAARYAPYMARSGDPSPFFKAPIWALLASHLHLITTHSQSNAAVSGQGAPYPVLIFSHGLMGGRIQNTIQAEHLASHGYVVVGIDHPYDASFAIFPDGHVICSQLLTAKADQPGKPSLRKDGIDVRVADVRLVLDRLPSVVSGTQLDGRLDFTKVGVFGHSFGGATALAAAAGDPRVKAAVSMDGSIGDVAVCTIPVLLIEGDRGSGGPLGSAAYRQRHRGQCRSLIIRGAGHANFTDLPFLSPLHWLSLKTGPIAPERFAETINTACREFFDQHLKGKGVSANESLAVKERQ